MAQQTIGIGTAANDGTGDPLRSAFIKVNANFTDLYSTVVFTGGALAGLATSSTTPAVVAQNTANANTVIALQLVGNRASPAALDAVGMNWVLNNASGTAKTFAQQFAIALTNTAGAEQGSFYWSIITAGAASNRMRLTSTALEPVSDGLIAFGNAARGWNGGFWSSGATLGFANGDFTLIHSTGVLTANKDLRVTTPGTNAASVVTNGGAQVLTNKELTVPKITNYTVATLPTVGTTGRLAYASDCRVITSGGTQQSVGSGTGGHVTDNGTSWKVAGTSVTAAA